MVRALLPVLMGVLESLDLRVGVMMMWVGQMGPTVDSAVGSLGLV